MSISSLFCQLSLVKFYFFKLHHATIRGEEKDVHNTFNPVSNDLSKELSSQ